MLVTSHMWFAWKRAEGKITQPLAYAGPTRMPTVNVAMLSGPWI